MKALSGDISYLAFVPSVSSQPGDKYECNILQWFCQGNNPLIFMLRAANWSLLSLLPCSEKYNILEIKPCGLGSRIRDVEADLIY